MSDPASAPARNRPPRVKKSKIVTVSERVDPLSWPDWSGTRYRHAGANDPRVRAAEPATPDVVGEKYIVVGGAPPTGALPLVAALARLIDRAEPRDRVVVAGSHRPVVVWRGAQPRIDYVGASAAEARAADASGLLVESGADHVILRIRMNRRTLARIKRAAERVRVATADPEGRRGKFVSTWALAVLLEALEALDREIEAVKAANFTGSPPS
jgi:hypothetical protein